MDKTLDKKWQWFDVPVFWRHNSRPKLHQHKLIYPRTTIRTVNLSKKKKSWNICLSVCLPACLSACLPACLALSDIRNSIYMFGGSHVSLYMKINTEWRWNNTKRGGGKGKPCLSATWSTTDLFRNFTTTSHNTVSSLTWPISKCYSLKILAVFSEMRTKRINTEARNCERQTWWCVSYQYALKVK
jgi:hypothetical protein